MVWPVTSGLRSSLGLTHTTPNVHLRDVSMKQPLLPLMISSYMEDVLVEL